MKYLEVYFDGSCGPQQPGGTASYGFIVKDEHGIVVHSASGFVGSGPGMSSNVAEFEAVYQAMVFISENFPDSNVKFHGDSALVITQMCGEATAKKGMYVPYAKKAVEFAAPFIEKGLWEFEWVPRAFNSEADDLAQRRTNL